MRCSKVYEINFLLPRENCAAGIAVLTARPNWLYEFKIREDINIIDDRVKKYGPAVENQRGVYENHRELMMHEYYAHSNPEGFLYHDEEYSKCIKERGKTCQLIEMLVQKINKFKPENYYEA